MKKERFILPCLIIGVTIGSAVSAFAKRESSQSDNQLPEAAGAQIFLPGGLPSEEGLAEQVEPKTIEGILSFMETIDEVKVRDASYRLKELYSQEILYLSLPGQSRRVPVVEAVGGWPDAQSSGFQIWVPQDFLVSPEFSEADKAIFIYQALMVYEEVKDLQTGDRYLSLKDRSRIEDQAWIKTIEDTHRAFSGQRVGPSLGLAFSQWAASKQNPIPETK